MVEDNLKDNKREDNPKAKAFIEDFFNKYSSSKSDDMAYLMDNPEGLEGTREVSQIREIRLYPKGDDYVAKVEILMKDKDSPLENLEHYTLDITKKMVNITLKIWLILLEVNVMSGLFNF